MRRPVRPAFFLVVLAALPLALSACAEMKPGSLTVTQPGGIGPIRVHFALCTVEENIGETSVPCAPSEREGRGQQIIAYAVPKGSTAPATITATAPGAPTLVFTRNQEVARRITELSPPGEEPWPPAGDEVVGYLSNVIEEHIGDDFEWSVDADFGLPAGSGGGTFASPYELGTGEGWRTVDDEHPADRPIDCEEGIISPPTIVEIFGTCHANSEIVKAPASDLKISAGAPVQAYAGDTVAVPFALDFATTSSSPPSFAVAGATSLPGATVTPAAPSLAPPAVDKSSHRAAPISDPLQVVTPGAAQPGTYQVTLTASTASGGKTSAAASLTLVKLKVRLGKLKLNRSNGTGTLTVQVPTAGTLTLAGKSVAKGKRTAKGPKTLKLKVRAKGKAKSRLRASGKARLKLKIAFQATSGASFAKAKRVTLKLSR